jgi:hypothetical protein
MTPKRFGFTERRSCGSLGTPNLQPMGIERLAGDANAVNESNGISLQRMAPRLPALPMSSHCSGNGPIVLLVSCRPLNRRPWSRIAPAAPLHGAELNSLAWNSIIQEWRRIPSDPGASPDYLLWRTRAPGVRAARMATSADAVPSIATHSCRQSFDARLAVQTTPPADLVCEL